jgi:tetratricopeptide (TPR) repeat protein
LAVDSVFIVTAAYASQTPGMAGGSYGMRWLLPLVPVFAFLMGLSYERLSGRAARALFTAAAVVSIVVAALGVPRPWSSNIRSPLTFLDNLAYFGQTLWPPAKAPVYWIVDATSLEPGYAYFEIGREHMNRGFHAAAIADLERARQLEPRRANLIDYYLGICYNETGRPDLAAQALERLIRNEPDNTGAWNNYALTLRRLRLPAAARKAYQQSLKIDPVKPSTLQGLAALCGELGRPAEAIPYFEAAVHQKPDDAGLRQALVNLYYAAGRKSQALEQLRRLQALDPRNKAVAEAIRKLENELAIHPK